MSSIFLRQINKDIVYKEAPINLHMFLSQWRNVFLRILLKEKCILAKILYRVLNIFDFSKDASFNKCTYHDMVIFWKLYISAEGKNTLKGFENNAKHRYKRNCLLLEAATGVALI